jgi:hypothetical protein
MNILMIGDVFGRPGRQAVKRLLPELREREQIDFVIVNGENSAGGKGISPETAAELLAMGCDVITGGNHSFANRDVERIMNTEPRLLRPANYPEGQGIPGSGWGVYSSAAGFPVGVLNLIGRVHINHYDCPFRTAAGVIEDLRRQTPILVVDFHAEATSEKVAMGWYLDGRVSAVLGTHTHIPTADECLLPRGTAYITDVGMTGPYDSIIGVKKEIALSAMLKMTPHRFDPATEDVRLCAVVIGVDALTGRAQSIRRLSIPVAIPPSR